VTAVGRGTLFATFGMQMLRAAIIDRGFYDAAARNRSLNAAAFLAVLITGVLTGIGFIDNEGARRIPVWIALSLMGWLVWSGVTYAIGSWVSGKYNPGVQWGQMARAAAFAQVPGGLRFAGIVPELGLVASVVALIWQFLAMAVAVRETFRFRSAWIGLAVVAIGLGPYLLIMVALVFLVQSRPA
jgi:hypothetical protein